MKATPKSCSCRQCMHAKHSPGGKVLVKKEERAFRHRSKQALRMGSDDIVPAVHGERIG